MTAQRQDALVGEHATDEHRGLARDHDAKEGGGLQGGRREDRCKHGRGRQLGEPVEHAHPPFLLIRAAAGTRSGRAPAAAAEQPTCDGRACSALCGTSRSSRAM
jgi:hypothetical protein